METIKRIGLILLAALVIVGLTIPLAQTEFADSLRGDDTGEGDTGGGDMGDMSGIAIYLMTGVKLLVVVSIPFGITLLILKLANRKKKQAS